MNKVIFSKSKIGGEITVPPSKSFAHRSIICAALSGGNCKVFNFTTSKDMEATLNFVTAIGMGYEVQGNVLRIFKSRSMAQNVNCMESGSTLRFVLPILGALGISTTLTGHGRLPERPMEVYSNLLPKFGVSMSSSNLPISIDGKLKSGVYEVPGNISSQFITGLLFALPLVDGNSEIHVIGDFQSKSYIDITLSVMKYYGVEILETNYGYKVKGNQQYKSVDYTVEGDWSQTAFFLTMGALSKDYLTIKGLNINSVQGDRKALELYKKIGADIVVGENIQIKKGEIRPFDVDAKDIPDVIPTLCACLALANGESLIYNAERLRIKESDRLLSTQKAINAIGGKVEILNDSLKIYGVKEFTSGKVDGYNDHRIVMTVASVMEAVKGDVEVSDPLSVNKSYPLFYEDFEKIGGVANVINMG